MAKKVFKIEAFEGGINQKADPRDINENQLEEAFNVDVSNVGRITVPGNALNVFSLTNIKDEKVYLWNDFVSLGNPVDGLTPGYGLFSFTHDFNLVGLADGESYPTFTPDAFETEFICINDGAHIDIWDSCHNAAGDASWMQSAITLGDAHVNDDAPAKVKPVYYKAGEGLRVCDGNFNEEKLNGVTNGTMTATTTTMAVDAGENETINNGTYVRRNSEIMKVTDNSSVNLTVVRGQFGTKAVVHGTASEDLYKVNVPKILTHVNRPLLEKSGANTTINKWVEDIQYPEPPVPGALIVYNYAGLIGKVGNYIASDTLYPSTPEKVFLSIQDTFSGEESFTLDNVAVSQVSGSTMTSIVQFQIADTEGTEIDIAAKGFSIGKILSISGCIGDGDIYNGQHEIVGFGSSIGDVKIISEFQTYTPPEAPAPTVILEEELMSDDLKNRYILGMSYLYQGSGNILQESSITTAQIAYAEDSNETPDTQGGMLISFNSFNFSSNGGWLTANASFATDTFDESESDNWVWENNKAIADAANNQYLIYRTSTDKIVADKQYIVYIKFSTFVSGTIVVGVGIDGSYSGGTLKTISPTSHGEYTFTVTSPSSGGDLSDVVVIKGSSFTGKIEQVAVWPADWVTMSAADEQSLDLRSYYNVGLGKFTFLCNNSRSGATQNNSWNERIEGFRIYMKQVDMLGGGLTDEWLLLYDANIKDGTYICHAKDGDEETLQLANYESDTDWSATSATDAEGLVTSNINGDSIRDVPLLTYEANNSYPAETNTAAMYKTAAIVNRKVFVGNLKIGQRTYPDRMIRALADKFDQFPDYTANYIDVAPSDGDSIVKLESFGDKLIQFKKKTAYLIKVSEDIEDLMETWTGAGILAPCQVAKTNMGIVWVNDNGLYYYDGSKLNIITNDRFRPSSWTVNEDENTPIIIGYDERSNKIIINTTNVSTGDNGGYIFDLETGAITECQNLLNWYMASEDSALTADSNIGAPMIVTGGGEGPPS